MVTSIFDSKDLDNYLKKERALSVQLDMEPDYL